MAHQGVVLQRVFFCFSVLLIFASKLVESTPSVGQDTDSKSKAAQDTESRSIPLSTSSIHSTNDVSTPSQIRNRRSNSLDENGQFYDDNAGGLDSAFLYSDQIMQNLLKTQSPKPLNYARSNFFLNLLKPRITRYNAWDDHSLMHFGKRSADSRDIDDKVLVKRSADVWSPNNVLHFGKKSDNSATDNETPEIISDAEIPNFEEDEGEMEPEETYPEDSWISNLHDSEESKEAEKTEATKKSDPWHNMMSFGKKSDSLWDHNTMHFGKRDEPWHSMMSFGKKSEPWHSMMSFGKKSDPWHNMMSFGKRYENSWDHNTLHFGKKDEPWHNMMSFGKKSANPWDHNTLHFGKRDPWDHNTLHFGKKDEPWHNMMSFGKKSANPWDHNTLHFGKRDPWDHNTLHFGKKDEPWHNMMSFGKKSDPWHSMMSFGKRSNNPWDHNTLHFGKRDDPWHNMMSFGKKSEISDMTDLEKRDDPWHNMMSFGKKSDGIWNNSMAPVDKREEPWHSMMSFGKKSDNGFGDHFTLHSGKRDEPWHNMMSFGKKSDNSWDPNTLHFGKRDEPWHNMMSFGKKSSPWGEHNTMHFGKRDEPWHSMMSFGKRPDRVADDLLEDFARNSDPWEEYNGMVFSKKGGPWDHNTLHFGKRSNASIDSILSTQKSETSDLSHVHKRSVDLWNDHHTMHFGKKSDPWESHNTMHFGKKSDPWESHNTMHFGKKSDPWDSHNTMHFGKKSDPWESHNTMHFGKKSDPWESHNTMHFGKKSDPWDSHNTMHFGKKSDPWESHNTVHFGKKSDPWESHNTMHFGKKSDILDSSNPMDVEKSSEFGDLENSLNVDKKFNWDSHNTMHFGKRNPWDYHNTMHFGKRDPWDGHNTMHFGKRDPWDYHNTMHFGKREPWDYHNTMHFGKRSDSKEKEDNAPSDDQSEGTKLKSLKNENAKKIPGSKVTEKEVPFKKRSLVSEKSSIKSSHDLNANKNNKIDDTSAGTLDNQKPALHSRVIKRSLKSIKTLTEDRQLNNDDKKKNNYELSSAESEEQIMKPNTPSNASDREDSEIKGTHATEHNEKPRINKRSVGIDPSSKSNDRNSESLEPNTGLFYEYSKSEFPDNVLHFGKRSIDAPEGNEIQWAGGTDDKRFDDYWGNHNTLHFGKKSDPWDSHNTLHFGKKSSPWENHSTMHFGKRNPWDYHNTLHFGKKFDPWEGHTKLHFGKRGDWEHNVMHFGKRGDWDHNVMHFGKRGDWDHNVMHFGKRDELTPEELENMRNTEDFLALLLDPEKLKDLVQVNNVKELLENQRSREFFEGLENLETAVNSHLNDENMPFEEKLNILKSYLKPIIKAIISEQTGKETDDSPFIDVEDYLDSDVNLKDFDENAGGDIGRPMLTLPKSIVNGIRYDEDIVPKDPDDSSEGIDDENSKSEDSSREYKNLLMSKRTYLGKPELKRYFVPFQGPKSIVYPHAWFASQIRRSSLPRTSDYARSMEMRMAEKKEDPFNSYMHFGRR